MQSNRNREKSQQRLCQSSLIQQLADKRAARLQASQVVRQQPCSEVDIDSDSLQDWSSDSESENKQPSASGFCAPRVFKRLAQKKIEASSEVESLLCGVQNLSIASAGLSKNQGTQGAECQKVKPSSSCTEAATDEGDETDFLCSRDSFTNGLVQPKLAAPKELHPDSLILGQSKEFVLDAKLSNKLYPHQVEGVKWLWSLYKLGRGGILADDMGLGKTMQISAFIAGMVKSGLFKRVLVIAPKTLLLHWEKELATCGMGPDTHDFYGSSESERSCSLRAVTRGRGVLLTTYGMVQHNSKQLAEPVSSAFSRQDDSRKLKWDLMVLDEGHKVKNPKMKLVEALAHIPVKLKVIISGTPIQNNLMEMHALFDFCTPGLLGDAREFKRKFAKPITEGQDRDATAREREVGAGVAAALRQIVAPHLLRREKKDVLGNKHTHTAGPDSLDNGNSISQSGKTAPKSLPHKNDLVVWLQLKPMQETIYKAFLHSDTVKQVLNETQSALAALSVLKKICDHPALLSNRAANNVIAGGHRWVKGKKTKHGYAADDDFIDDSDSEYETADSGSEMNDYDESDDFVSEDSSDDGSLPNQRRHGISVKAAAKVHKAQPADEPDSLPNIEWGAEGGLESQLLSELEAKGAQASCKTAFVLELVQHLTATGHRTLIFSQSRVMLDIIQAGIKALGMSFCRIDGTLNTAQDRQAQVKKFQTTPSIPVFLLTSQVGGLGLTLTEADRVIIVDPNWNPAVDNQSVDRAYRIGQHRNVVVYRLITCGTVEEKIYRKQVFKGGLSRAGIEEGVQFRYFTQMELRDLFQVTEQGFQDSDTQKQLHALHASQRKANDEVKRHLKFLETLQGYRGISDHDLLFSQRPDEQEVTADQGREYLSQMSAAAARAVYQPTNYRPGPMGSAHSSGAGSLDNLHATSSTSAGGPTVPPAVAAARMKVDSLRAQVQRLQAILHTRNLPDQGRKVKEHVAAIHLQLVDAEAELHRLQAPALQLQQQQSTAPLVTPSQIAAHTMEPASSGFYDPAASQAGSQSMPRSASDEAGSVFQAAIDAGSTLSVSSLADRLAAMSYTQPSVNLSHSALSGFADAASGLSLAPSSIRSQPEQVRKHGFNISLSRNRTAGQHVPAMAAKPVVIDLTDE